MRKLAAAAIVVFGLELTAFAGGRAGDQWVGRRGDLNPGTSYRAMTATHTGRLVAVGDAGMLMLSDDGGSTWTFQTLTTSAGAVDAPLDDVQEFTVANGGQKRLAVISAEFEDPSVVDSNIATFFPWADWAAKTTLYLSDDDGRTWTRQPFPYGRANFGGRDYYGVNLTGLHVAPNGQLLAFGTTSLATRFLLQWNTGGLIYRSDDGVNWTLAEFGLGPLSEIADAGGRAVAVGATSAFDTVDGAGWNGYRMRDAVLNEPGSGPLDAATSDRLRLLDVAYQNGTYVANAVTYVPFDAALGIDTSTVDKRWYLESAAPFGGGRAWTAHPQTSDHGKFLPSTIGLLGFDAGVQKSVDDGATWNMVDATVITRSRTVARINSTTISALGSSAAAWKSVNDGATWTQVWNPPTGADLRLAGAFGGTVLAFGSNTSDLYASTNDGVDWSLRATGVSNGLAITQTGNRLVMVEGSAASARTSDDGGATWQDRTVDAASIAAGAGIVTTKTGRVVIAAEGKDVTNEGKFYVSDDGGVTWLPRSIHSTWQEMPRATICTPTGRLITVTNTFALFNPRIVRSDDNGETWTGDTQLQRLDGLSTITGDPSTKVIQPVCLLSDGANLVMAGEDAIVYSKDDGTTWNFALHLAPPYDQFLMGVGATGRFVVFGRKKDAANNWRHFAMTSDDGGATWRENPIPLNQSNTFLLWAAHGVGDRVIASGTNAAVYTSDGPGLPTTAPFGLTVREGNVLTIDVPRPPVPGAVSVRYSAVQGTALANADFAPLGGQLDWTDTETASKQIQLVTVDDTAVEPVEQLNVQLVYDDGTVQGTSDIPVTIEDDDGLPAGIELVDPTNLYTTEAGGTATLLVALNKKPTADVTLAITGADATEGTLSTSSMTFTPTNWNVQQPLVITGVDDSVADGDVAYTLAFTPSGADAAYAALAPATASVVNVDDDAPATGGGGGITFGKGSITDKAKALKDAISLSGTFAKLGKTFTPATVAGSFSFGDPASPVRIDFTANDVRWKHKKTKWIWTSAKAVNPHVVVTIDAVKGTFTIVVSKLDLAAAPATGFLATLDAGGKSGGGTFVFIDKNKGRFRYP